LSSQRRRQQPTFSTFVHARYSHKPVALAACASSHSHKNAAICCSRFWRNHARRSQCRQAARARPDPRDLGLCEVCRTSSTPLPTDLQNLNRKDDCENECIISQRAGWMCRNVIKVRNVDTDKALHLAGMVAGGLLLSKVSPASLETIPASFTVRIPPPPVAAC